MIKFVTFTALMTFIFTCHAVTIETKNTSFEKFNYLKFNDNSLQSTHDIKLSLRMPSEYKLIKPISYQAVFNEIQFNVSVAGFVKGNSLLFVSAEQVSSCSDDVITDSFKARFNKKLKQTIDLTKISQIH